MYTQAHPSLHSVHFVMPAVPASCFPPFSSHPGPISHLLPPPAPAPPYSTQVARGIHALVGGEVDHATPDAAPLGDDTKMLRRLLALNLMAREGWAPDTQLWKVRKCSLSVVHCAHRLELGCQSMSAPCAVIILEPGYLIFQHACCDGWCLPHIHCQVMQPDR
jgi:hypothetical protein